MKTFARTLACLLLAAASAGAATKFNPFTGKPDYTGSSAGTTVQIPQTAVAVGTSSNTVTGDSTTFSADLTTGQVYIKSVSGSTPTLILDDPGFGPVDVAKIAFLDGAQEEFQLRYSNQNNPYGRLYLTGFNGVSRIEMQSWRQDGSGTTINVPATFLGTVNISSGITCGGAAGTSGQFLTSGGAGGPCTWATGSSGGASSLAVTTGTSAGFTSLASSPTAIVNFDSSTFAASLTGSATAYVTLNASSVTLQGNNYASATSTGVLKPADWSTFNGKGSGDMVLASTQTSTGAKTFQGGAGGNSVPLTINQLSTSGTGNHGLVVTSTGTGTPVQINVQGLPSNGYQNMIGGVTINNPDNNVSKPLLVLVDSSTDNTNGDGLLELWEQASAHNSYLLWIHGNSSRNSDEPIRFDGPTYGIDEVSSSTDSAHGLGKWKVISIANATTDLQLASSRAWDNSTFEHLIRVHQLSASDTIPGIYFSPQSVANDSAVLSSSDTTGIVFEGRNGSSRGLTGPLDPTGSAVYALPNETTIQGQVWVGKDNGRGNNFSVRSTAFTSGGSTGNCLQYNSGSVPTWGSCNGALAVGTGTISAMTATSSPTAIITFDSNTFTAALAGSATTFMALNASSVTLQGNNLAATYLTNSSATATYLNQSSATATYANKSVFATTTSTGVLSATDWNTFNGKQAAGSYLTAVAVQGPLQGNGTAGSPLFTSTATATSTGSLTSTDWNTFNNKQASGAYLTAVTAQAPISGNGTAGSPLITSTATATSTGSLTATDWSTFNGKGVGTITGITTQNGIIGGGTSGALTISVSSVSLSTQVVGNLPTTNLNSGTGATSSTFWRGDGSWASVTGSGDNLGNHVATTTLNMATFGISNIGTSSSTFDAVGALTTNSSATIAGPLFISSQVTTTGNYTANGSDSVIYGNVTGSTITITLPKASNKGQVLTIYKVDTGTNPVIVSAAGSDTIVGISTVTLWAYGYQQTLRADGTSTWWPVGRLASQPMTMGWNSDIAGAAAGVANRMYFYSWRLDDPCDTKSIRYMNGAVSGNLFFAIYNETGNVMVSSGPFAMPAGATAAHTINITKKNLQPGLYYVGFGADNITATFQRYASDQVGGQYSKGSMNPIPVSIGYPPTFDSATSSRAPTLTVQCYGGPADL